MSYRPSLRFAGVCVLSALGSCNTDNLEPEIPPGASAPQAPVQALTSSSDTVPAIADSRLKTAARNNNYGASQTLPVKITVTTDDTVRAIVKFDQAAIVAAIGSGTLGGATLELPIKESGTDPAGSDIDVHRVLKPWTEFGVTWKCGEDLDTANAGADCPATKWKMSGPGADAFVAARTARVHLTPAQTGVARFDVTSDVQAFLAGGSNHGWLVNAASLASYALFWSRESAAKPRLVLSVSRNSTPVPALPPDSISQVVWDDLHAATNLVTNDGRLTGEFPRNLVAIMFHSAAPAAQRQAAVDSIQGEVVGGIRITQGGLYYVRVQDDGTAEPLFAAIDKLQSLTQVDYAIPEPPKLSPLYLNPKDGPGWQSWGLEPGSATGTKWGLEAIAAPMAWGCSTGDSTLSIGVIDHGFHSVSDLFDNADPNAMAQYGAFPGVSHGTKVASILGAVGNNQSGMTGVMWRARLNLLEYSVHGSMDVGYAAQALEIAGNLGNPIISLSSGLYWLEQEHRLPLNTPGDSAKARNVHRVFKSTIAGLDTAGKRPLIVIAASNDGIDAFWSGTASLQTDFPNQVIIVAASDSTDALLPASNRGPLVSVAAPGRTVGTLTQTGTVQPDSGTSMATPFVAGLAGLLRSFDSRLLASDLKSAILAGAAAGGRTAGGIPIINAYESLKWAARRSQAPLCGNRVWFSGNDIKVERGTGPETLVDAGVPVNWIETWHGAKRITFYAGGVPGAAAFENGSWHLTPRIPADDLLEGQNAGYSYSHDWDRYVTAQSLNSPETVEIAVSDTGEVLNTIVVASLPLQNLPPPIYHCVLQYSPIPAEGDEPNWTCVDSLAANGGVNNWSPSDPVPAVAYHPWGDSVLIARPWTSLHGAGPIGGWEPCEQGSGGVLWQCRPFGAQYVVDSTTVYRAEITNNASLQRLWSQPGLVSQLSIAEGGAGEVAVYAVTTSRSIRGNHVGWESLDWVTTGCKTEFRRGYSSSPDQTLPNPTCSGLQGRTANVIASQRRLTTH